jgi:hypothetical protein
VANATSQSLYRLISAPTVLVEHLGTSLSFSPFDMHATGVYHSRPEGSSTSQPKGEALTGEPFRVAPVEYGPGEVGVLPLQASAANPYHPSVEKDIGVTAVSVNPYPATGE